MITIPIEISARHVHLSQKDLNRLFGQNYQLTPIKDLSQQGQFACKEMVGVQTLQSWGVKPHMDFTFGKAPDHNQIRVLGPVREHTQIELSWSDFIGLGLEPTVTLSGDYKRSIGGIILIGPCGQVELNKGVIIAQRHIHCSKIKAQEYSFQDRQVVSVKTVDDVRQITFHNVIVRIHHNFDWQMHIDTDEANAAGIRSQRVGEIII